VPVDSAEGAPDISLEFGGGRVDHVPEVDLVGQFWEGGQECLDGGIRASGREVLKFTVSNFFHDLGNVGHPLTGRVRETTPEKMSGRARPASQQIELPQSCLG